MSRTQTPCFDAELPQHAALAQVTHWVSPHDGVEWIATYPVGQGRRAARLYLTPTVTLAQVEDLHATLEAHGCSISLAYGHPPTWVDA